MMNSLLKLEKAYKAGKLSLSKFRDSIRKNLKEIELTDGVWLKAPEGSMLKNIAFAHRAELDCELLDELPRSTL